MKIRCINNFFNLLNVDLIKGQIYDGELIYSNPHRQNRWKVKGFENYLFKEDRFEIVKDEVNKL